MFESSQSFFLRKFMDREGSKDSIKIILIVPRLGHIFIEKHHPPQSPVPGICHLHHPFRDVHSHHFAFVSDCLSYPWGDSSRSRTEVQNLLPLFRSEDPNGPFQKIRILSDGGEIDKDIVVRSYLFEETETMLIQCQMSKPARSDEPKVNQVQIKLKIQMFKKESFDIKPFDIHLAFEL